MSPPPDRVSTGGRVNTAFLNLNQCTGSLEDDGGLLFRRLGYGMGFRRATLFTLPVISSVVGFTLGLSKPLLWLITLHLRWSFPSLSSL